jgi:hypothetical protein
LNRRPVSDKSESNDTLHFSALPNGPAKLSIPLAYWDSKLYKRIFTLGVKNPAIIAVVYSFFFLLPSRTSCSSRLEPVDPYDYRAVLVVTPNCLVSLSVQDPAKIV